MQALPAARRSSPPETLARASNQPPHQPHTPQHPHLAGMKMSKSLGNVVDPRSVITGGKASKQARAACTRGACVGHLTGHLMARGGRALFLQPSPSQP